MQKRMNVSAVVGLPAILVISVLAGCAGRLTGPDRADVPKGVNVALLDTLQRDYAIFVQPRYLFVLPAPADARFDPKRTALADSVMVRGATRKIWIISNTQGDWAQIIEHDALPLVAKGPTNAEVSLRRYAMAHDSAAKANPRWEFKGSEIKGVGDATSYRQMVWDKTQSKYLRLRCHPSPDGRVIPVFVCITAASADSMTFDPEVRGLQFADHVPGFKLPPNLADVAKTDTTAKRK